LPNPEKSRSAVQPTIYHHATTDAQGRFVFHVGPGRYYLGGPGQVKGVSFTVTDEPQVEFNFNAPREEEGRVAGLVVTGNPPTPLADALIDGVYKAWSGRVDPQAKTDKHGRFTMERQRHPLVLHARSGDGKLAGIIEIGADDVTAIIPVDKIATARGRLVDAGTGAPLAGRELWYGVRIPIGQEPNAAFSTSFGGKVRTDAEGRFELKRLTARREHRVSLTAEDGQSWRELHTFTPTPGQAVDLKDLRVAPPRRPRP
jgi:hypothetical protein